MPENNYTDALREAFASATKNLAVLDTVEISNPAAYGIPSPDSDTFYLVNNKEGLDLTDEDANTNYFEPVAFRLQRPKQGESGSQELSLTVDNVDRRIGLFIKAVRNSQVPTNIKQRYFLSNDLTQPQTIQPLELTIIEASVSAFEVTCRARFVDVLNKSFPNELYTRSRFPSLGG